MSTLSFYFKQIRLKFFFFLLINIFSPAYSLDDYPMATQLWLDSGMSVIQLNCVPSNNNKNEISCETITSYFSRSAEAEDLEKATANPEFAKYFDKAGNLKSDMGTEFTKMCNGEYIEPMRYVVGLPTLKKISPEKKLEYEKYKVDYEKKLNSLKDGERKDTIDEFKALLEFCEKKTFDSLLSMGIQSHKVNEKTCSVTMRRDENSFKKIKDGIFVYETGPDTSDCATIKIETIRKTGKNFWEWEFEFKTISLNPDGKTVFGNSCKERDAKPDIYRKMPSRNKFVNCAYFK